jgi:hypothetical protein
VVRSYSTPDTTGRKVAFPVDFYGFACGFTWFPWWFYLVSLVVVSLLILSVYLVVLSSFSTGLSAFPSGFVWFTW